MRKIGDLKSEIGDRSSQISSFKSLILFKSRQHPFPAEVEWHDVLPSTNDRAMELSGQADVNTPVLIVAGEQTAGRGRGNNRWWSSSGALTFTLLFNPTHDLVRAGAPGLREEQWPRVALVAGLALCESLEELLPHLRFGLKWPNDVLLEGKKLAGILVEVPPNRPPAPRRLVLGLGINVNNSFAEAPPDVRQVGTSLCDAAGLEVDATAVLAAWLTRFAENLQALSADEPALPDRWQERCVLRGRTIELQAGDRQVGGVCQGIGRDGALLVDTPAGPERLYGGALVRVSG